LIVPPSNAGRNLFMQHFKSISPHFTEKSIERAAQLQAQMHEFVEKTMKENKIISYQDATNTFLLLKIAEAEAFSANELISNDLQAWHDNQFKK
jgi:hypothetical protein